jgi:hypothetical protein
MDLGEWSPDISQYLNSGNIKRTTPFEFTRRNGSTVPVVNSGIPFMPKSSKVFESMTVHLYSKDKYVMFTSVQSKGVPYCDDFEIHYKKVVESAGEGKSL